MEEKIFKAKPMVIHKVSIVESLKSMHVGEIKMFDADDFLSELTDQEREQNPTKDAQREVVAIKFSKKASYLKKHGMYFSTERKKGDERYVLVSRFE